MRLTLERRRWIWAYLFLAVPLVFFLSIRIGPTLYAFWMSLHEWDLIALDRPFIGLENFRELADDDTFWNGTPEQLAERLAPYVELGFGTVISEQPAPYDTETLERLIGQVKPLIDRR